MEPGLYTVSLTIASFTDFAVEEKTAYIEVSETVPASNPYWLFLLAVLILPPGLRAVLIRKR
jgi:PKD repeat protein